MCAHMMQLLLVFECDILTAADALTERFLIFFFSGSLVSSLVRFTGGGLLSIIGGYNDELTHNTTSLIMLLCTFDPITFRFFLRDTLWSSSEDTAASSSSSSSSASQ